MCVRASVCLRSRRTGVPFSLSSKEMKMNEAVRRAVQGRDGAGTAQSGGPATDAIITKPWAPRTDGKHAVQVSVRSVVFDTKAAPLLALDPAVALSDPIWNHREFSAWTPDLVHCRLLVAGEIVSRMPPVLRRGYVSQLGNIAITEAASVRRIAPTPAEITLADWTLGEIMARRHRQQLLLAAAFGYSMEKIAKALKAIGLDATKSTVHRWYMDERRQLAAQWQSKRETEVAAKVDGLTTDRWHAVFDKAKK